MIALQKVGMTIKAESILLPAQNWSTNKLVNIIFSWAIMTTSVDKITFPAFFILKLYNEYDNLISNTEKSGIPNQI